MIDKMSWLMRRCRYNNIIKTYKIIRISMTTSAIRNDDDTEFRVLQLTITDRKIERKKKFIENNPNKERTNNMSAIQNWQAVWPTTRTFHPHIVPLPIRQGYQNNDGVHPSRFSTTELMKIPNFLHLTPPVVKRHCDALKQFCTKWPKELETDEECEKHFPVQIITSDYCYSSPSIRDPLARIVSANLKLSSLYLNAHAKDKMLRLLGDKYTPKTDMITITVDRCPTRKQNLDYVKYLLTALFHISWRIEPWEVEKSEADMEYYDWDKSRSKASLISLNSWPNSPTDLNYEDLPHVAEYKTAVSELMSNNEDQLLINKYKQAVKNVLNLKCSSSI